MFVGGFFVSINGQSVGYNRAKLSLAGNTWSGIGTSGFAPNAIETTITDFHPVGIFVYINFFDDTLRKINIVTNQVVQKFKL